MPVRGDSSPGGVPWESSTVRVVLLATAVAPLGVPLVTPALPAIRDALELTDARASLLISLYFVAGIVLSPAIGTLADRVGRRGVLVPSLLVFGAAGAAVGLAPPYEIVLGLRVAQGTAAAGLFVTTVTIVGDAFEGPRRNAVLGANVAALFAGAAVYPLVGGVLTEISWNAPFFAHVLVVPVVLYAALRLEEPAEWRAAADARPARWSPLEAAKRVTGVLRRPVGVGLYLATLAGELLSFGAIFTALPFLLDAGYGASGVVIGGIVTTAAATSGVVAWYNGRLAARVSSVVLVAAAFVCYGVGLALVWAAGEVPSSARSVAVLSAGALVFGVGTGFLLPSVDAALTDVVSAGRRASALALRNSTTFLGRTSGPLAFAWLAGGTVAGYRGVIAASGAIALVAGVGTVGVLLRRR